MEDAHVFGEIGSLCFCRVGVGPLSRQKAPSSSLHQTASHQSRGGVVGMDWLFSGGVSAKNVDDGSVVNLLDFLYAVLDSLMKSVFL